jgi:hypothetical protein
VAVILSVDMALEAIVMAVYTQRRLGLQVRLGLDPSGVPTTMRFLLSLAAGLGGYLVTTRLIDPRAIDEVRGLAARVAARAAES